MYFQIRTTLFSSFSSSSPLPVHYHLLHLHTYLPSTGFEPKNTPSRLFSGLCLPSTFNKIFLCDDLSTDTVKWSCLQCSLSFFAVVLWASWNEQVPILYLPGLCILFEIWICELMFTWSPSGDCAIEVLVLLGNFESGWDKWAEYVPEHWCLDNNGAREAKGSSTLSG